MASPTHQIARNSNLPPSEAHIQPAGLGHISEITTGDSPQLPRGCPFQAWSLGENLQLNCDVQRHDDEL